MLGKLENLLLALGAVAVIALGAMIATNVVLRTFGLALPDTVTLVRELMVAAILFPLAATTAARAHVAVEFITNRFNDRVRSGLIVFGSIVGMFALAPLLYAGVRELADTWGSGGFYYGDLNLPKWPGRLLFVIGIGACWFRLAELALRDTLTLLHGGVIDDQHDPTEAE